MQGGNIMVHSGYKSPRSTINILNKNYPNFVQKCITSDEGYVHSDMSLLRIFTKKVFYPINLRNLSATTGDHDWLPETRNKELNDFLNFIENCDDIKQLLLMSEL